MTEEKRPRARPSSIAVRLFQLLILLSGVVWAFTLSHECLDQMQWPGFLIALSISWWLTPEIRARAMRLGLVDKLGEETGETRRIHKVAVPRLGGVAIYISLLATFVVVMAVGGRFPKEGGLAGIVAGGTLIFVLGLLDDLDSIPAKVKLLVQILAAWAAYTLGVRVDKRLPLAFAVPFLGIDYGINLGPFALPLTILWLVGVANAVNLIDGMDGLAAGVSAIASVTIWAIALGVTTSHPVAQPYPALCAAILAGALLGFLRWNFNPARIFLGDSGAYLTGFILGCVAITGVTKTATVATVFLPMLVLFFPILDTTWAVVRRLARGRPIFSPDAEHIHHRLLNTGLSQKKVAYLIYLFSAALGLLACCVVKQQMQFLTIAGSVLFMALFFSEVLNRSRQRRAGEAGTMPDEPPDSVAVFPEPKRKRPEMPPLLREKSERPSEGDESSSRDPGTPVK